MSNKGRLCHSRKSCPTAGMSHTAQPLVRSRNQLAVVPCNEKLWDIQFIYSDCASANTCTKQSGFRVPLGNKRPNRPNFQEVPTRCRTRRSTWSSCAIRAMRSYQCCASWRAGSSSPGRYPLSTSLKTGGGRRARRRLPALITPGGRTRSFGQAEPAALPLDLRKQGAALLSIAGCYAKQLFASPAPLGSDDPPKFVSQMMKVGRNVTNRRPNIIRRLTASVQLLFRSIEMPQNTSGYSALALKTSASLRPRKSAAD